RGWTRLLVLDLDANEHGAAAVSRDAQGLRRLVTSAGGAIVEDFNPGSGGRHLLVPLAEPVRLDSVRPVLNVLKRLYPTLDVAPMVNTETGCIVPPGSFTKEGSRRQLVGTITAASDALVSRSGRGLLPRLLAEVGSTAAVVDRAHAQSRSRSICGKQRLSEDLILTTPLPDRILAFAEHGHRQKYWPTRSEARQAVLTACVLRGWSLQDVMVAAVRWAGFKDAYAHYAKPAKQITADWNKAFTWAEANAPKFRSAGHKTKPQRGLLGTALHSTWLADSRRWALSNLRGRSLHSTLNVLQAVAACAAVAGEIVNEVACVEVGIRSLSLAAGMMSETSVAEVLAELRDTPGSPLLRVRRAAGVLADRYALVAPSLRETDPIRRARARVEPVHIAWRELGPHLRTVYELIIHEGLTHPADVFAAAHIGTSAGHDALDVLTTVGLIRRSRGGVEPGDISLDDIATAQELDHRREETIARFKRERNEWRMWLELRGHLEPQSPVPSDLDTEPAGIAGAPPGWEIVFEDAELLWEARLAAG
ncbi:MAG: hypothetical protein ABFC80_10210, partial [Coriobacteriales bacterium]